MRKLRINLKITSLKLSALVLSALILPLFLSGCYSRNASDRYIERTGFYFDTVINVRIYDSQDEKLLDKCMELASQYDSLLSPTNEESDIYKINTSHGAPTTVSSDTIQLLETSLYYANLTDGALNPALGNVIDLWDFTSEGTHSVPSANDITAALEHIDYTQIDIDELSRTVTLNDADMKIGLGAVAKGFIADKFKEYLESEDIHSAIINLGGNVLLIGSKPGGRDFTVGIEKPFGGTSSYAATVSMSGRSLVTSGVYERYFEKDGKIYHHILDPSTGYSSESGLLSVTILSDKSVDGDALSTSCFVMGMDKAAELIESLEDTEAAFITTDNQIHYTSGFPRE